MTGFPETVGGAPVVALLLSIALALVHLLGGRVSIADPERLRRALSAAGGASVAYVFVLLFPEVSEAALVVGELRAEALLAEQFVYLVALAGFVSFYGVEVFVAQYRGESVEDAPLVFWVHVAVFALYSAIIGYLLFHQETQSILGLLFYALAMALHFGVTDYGLRRHHGDAFDGIGRWVLAAGVLVGSAIGLATELAGLRLAMLFGFVAGAIVLNVVKEELPEIDESRFAAFAAGAVIYTLVLLLT